MTETHEAKAERREAEERGAGLVPDTSPTRALAGDLSDVDPEGRDMVKPPPVSEASEDD